MTDKKDQTELQDDVLQMEGEPQVEEWQGELPPEDDFHDQGEFQDDLQNEIVEEALAANAYDDQQEPIEADKGKRGKAVFIGVLAVGALFMGGLAYLQFGVSSDAESTGPLVPVSSVLDIQDIKNASPQNMSAVAAAEDMNQNVPLDPSKLFDGLRSPPADEKKALPGAEPSELVMDKPIESMSSEVVSTTSAALPPMPQVEATVPLAVQKSVQNDRMPVPPPALDRDVQIAKVENIPLPRSDKADAKDAKPASTPVAAISPEVEQRLKDLSGQVDTLKKSLDEATKRNASLLTEVEALHKAESKQKAAVAKADKAAAAALEDSLLGGTDPVATPPKPTEAKAVPKKAKTKVTPAAKKTTPKAPAWVLRAATPDAVWVATSPESAELRRVAVGETLPGLGKVKEIRQSGEAWEVVGTSATLR